MKSEKNPRRVVALDVQFSDSRYCGGGYHLRILSDMKFCVLKLRFIENFNGEMSYGLFDELCL